MHSKLFSTWICRLTLSLDHHTSLSKELGLQVGLPRTVRTAQWSLSSEIATCFGSHFQLHHVYQSYPPLVTFFFFLQTASRYVSHAGLQTIGLWYLRWRESTTQPHDLFSWFLHCFSFLCQQFITLLPAPWWLHSPSAKGIWRQLRKARHMVSVTVPPTKHPML